MKSKLALVISLIIAMPIQAEYMVKIPLEKSQGGTLPDGSIKIGNVNNNNPTLPIAPPTENEPEPVEPPIDPASCKFDDNNFYYELLNDQNEIILTEAAYNGWDMYLPLGKGKLVDTGSEYRLYEACYTVPETGEWVNIPPLYEWDNDYYCPITMPNLDEIASINVTFQETHEGINYYYGSATLPTYCNTRARNVTLLRQHTKTLEVQEVDYYSEIIEVPTYEDGGNWTVSCDYNRQPNSINYTSKWLVDGSSASYYHFDNVYPLPSSSTRLDETKASIGGGYWARGMFMESYNGVSHYALCYWGGW